MRINQAPHQIAKTRSTYFRKCNFSPVQMSPLTLAFYVECEFDVEDAEALALTWNYIDWKGA